MVWRWSCELLLVAGRVRKMNVARIADGFGQNPEFQIRQHVYGARRQCPVVLGTPGLHLVVGEAHLYFGIVRSEPRDAVLEMQREDVRRSVYRAEDPNDVLPLLKIE